MLDMLGEDARAAVGKVKSLQSKGATPDQVQAQMMEAARNGLLPISVAFAAQKALQRQNATPAPQGTVVGDMLGQLQQSRNPREQGIAGLPNPMMDNAQFAGGGVVAFAEAGSTSKGIKTFTDPKTGEMYRLDDKGNRVPLTPTQIRRLQIENDQRSMKGAIGSMGIYPATAFDMVANPLNVTLGGIESAANAIGIPRAGRAVGAYDPDVTYVTMPRIGDGKVNPGQRAVDEMIANSGSTDVIPTEETATSAAAKKKKEQDAAAGLGALDAAKLKLYSSGNDATPDRSAFAGVRVPHMSTAGYDQVMGKAISQFEPTAQETADAKKTRDELGQEEADRFERLGIGAGRKKQLEKNVKKREDLESDRKRSKLEEIGLGFLTEGVAAASRGESTLGSLASGFGAGLKGAKISKEKLDAAEDKLDEQEAALDAQGEALALQGDANGLKMYEMHQTRLRDARKIVGELQLQQASMRINVDQFNVGNDFKLMLAEAAATAAKNKSEKESDVWIKKAGRAFEAGDKTTGMEYLRIAAGFTAAGSGGVQVEQLRQAGKAAETAALTGNPAGAQAGGGTGRVVNVRPST
jgi:hypothetical protein